MKHWMGSLSSRVVAVEMIVLGLALATARAGDGTTLQEQPKQPQERHNESPAGKIRKDQLRYGGRSFEQWREQLLTELMPKARLESIKVLIVFAHHGYAVETTAALLEVGRGFETLLELEESEYEGAFERKLFRSNNDEPDEEAVLEASAEAMVKIGPAAVPVLRGGLKDESRAVRFFSLHFLGKLRSHAKAAVPDVIEIIQGRDLNLRRAALAILGKIGAKDKRVLPPIRAALKDKKKEIRCVALDALGELGSEIADPASPDIVEALNDRVPEVREKAIATLKRSNLGAKAVPPLLKAIQDTDAEVQHQAYLHLQQLGPQAKAAVPKLIAILKRSPSKEDKKKNRQIRGPRITDIPLSGEAYLLVPFDELSHVIETLGAIGPDAKEAAPVLKKMLEKAKAAQKEKIADALKKIAGEIRPSPGSSGGPGISPF